MRVRNLLLFMPIVFAVSVQSAAWQVEPLSLEFLEFLGEIPEQEGLLELLITVEAAPVVGLGGDADKVPYVVEAGASDDE